MKTLDAHFARVCGLLAVTVNNRLNKLISSSLDKTIKVSDLHTLIDVKVMHHRNHSKQA